MTQPQPQPQPDEPQPQRDEPQPQPDELQPQEAHPEGPHPEGPHPDGPRTTASPEPAGSTSESGPDADRSEDASGSENAPGSDDAADSTDAGGADDATGSATSAGAPATSLTAATDGPSPWRLIADSLRQPRITAGGLVIAILVAILGFALVAQVKTNDSSSSTFSSQRPDDLVRILSDLDSRKDRLNSDITNLQETQRELNSGAESKQAALDAATARADELGILAGTLPAVGSGIVISLQPGKTAVNATDVLETVEELRGAGAEAMEIGGENGPSVRIIASTWFVDGTNGVIVSGIQLTGKLTISVIGDAQTMQTALTIPGGVDDSVQHDGGTVLVAPPSTVRVTTLAPPVSMKYAHPAS